MIKKVKVSDEGKKSTNSKANSDKKKAIKDKKTIKETPEQLSEYKIEGVNERVIFETSDQSLNETKSFKEVLNKSINKSDFN